MQAKAIALIHILRGALIELEQNPKSDPATVSTGDIRNSMLQAIRELELVGAGSQDLRAA